MELWCSDPFFSLQEHTDWEELGSGLPGPFSCIPEWAATFLQAKETVTANLKIFCISLTGRNNLCSSKKHGLLFV